MRISIQEHPSIMNDLKNIQSRHLTKSSEENAFQKPHHAKSQSCIDPKKALYLKMRGGQAAPIF
jgi:hypothetical protein